MKKIKSIFLPSKKTDNEFFMANSQNMFLFISYAMLLLFAQNLLSLCQKHSQTHTHTSLYFISSIIFYVLLKTMTIIDAYNWVSYTFIFIENCNGADDDDDDEREREVMGEAC